MVNRKTLIKALVVLVVSVIFAGTACPVAYASWLIDEKQYHVSVHGRFPCLTCHPQIQTGKLHPDPAMVNRSSDSFFKPETCAPCHYKIMDDFGRGEHGRRKVSAAENFQVCVKCHNPHTRVSQAVLTSLWDRYDQAKPLSRQCGLCHAERDVLPPPMVQDQACLDCHRAYDPLDPERIDKIGAFCLHCHGPDSKTWTTEIEVDVPLVDLTGLTGTSPHAGVACLECHPDSARFSHGGRQAPECRSCHLPHPASTAHEVHLNVACQACHLQEAVPYRNSGTGEVLVLKTDSGKPSGSHNLLAEPDESSCRRCHTKGNSVGAAALIFPPKSVICMPCHAATFSVKDPITVTALVVFFIGLILVSSVWFAGSFKREQEPFKPMRKSRPAILRVLSVFRALILDVFLNRRLFRQSPARWIIHGLIFYPFVFRFSWGLIGLIASRLTPGQDFTWAMLNQNNSLTAFAFDLSGFLVVLGVCLAVAGKLMAKGRALPGLPKPDYLALILLGGIIILGFVLEGLRIAMTSPPPGAEYAFIGYGLSQFMAGPSLTSIFAVFWFLHAIFTGLFVAYLPFSRMFHLIMAPIVLMANAFHGD